MTKKERTYIKKLISEYEAAYNDRMIEAETCCYEIVSLQYSDEAKMFKAKSLLLKQLLKELDNL